MHPRPSPAPHDLESAHGVSPLAVNTGFLFLGITRLWGRMGLGGGEVLLVLLDLLPLLFFLC